MAGISLSDFFKTKRETSEIKSEILNEYFKAWAAILLKGQSFKKIDKLLYVDLFSGPGIYDDGTPSTPIKILNSIIESQGSYIDFDKAVLTIFNDKTQKMAAQLKENINNLPYYAKLTNKPIIGNEPASIDLLKHATKSNYPSLTFIDPLGYGFTQKMLLYSIKSWGSDLFVLFNMNRIRAAINNALVKENMQGIFSDSLESIQKFYAAENSPVKREQFIIRKFEKIFTDQGYKILKFRVNFPNRNQTSHYLYFISKVDIAIIRAKEIMTKYSDIQPDGVPLLGANLKQSPIFYPYQCEYSIMKLKEYLSANKLRFHLKTIDYIYRKTSYGTAYIKPNYKEAVKLLMEEGNITLIDIKGRESSRLTYTAKLNYK